MEASIPPPSPQLQDDAGDGGGGEGASPGAYNVGPFIFLSGNLVRGVVEVAEVAGVEFGDMHLKSSRISPWKAAFQAKCSSMSFVRVGSPSGGSPPFTAQRSPIPSSYSLSIKQNNEWRTTTSLPPSIVRSPRQSSPSEWRPARLLQKS